MATLPQLKVQRLYRQIADLLIQRFKDGEFEVGSALPAERDLAQQLGVSRSSVREALIALELAGWVDIKTGHGVFVCDGLAQAPADGPAGSASVEELLAARELIEGETARLAAENADEAQLATLRDIMAEMEKPALEKSRFLAQDARFHQLISDMADNALYTQFVATLWDSQRRGQFAGFEDHYGDAAVDIWNVDHRAISAAILGRDADAAKLAMQLHIRNVYAKFFAENPAAKPR